MKFFIITAVIIIILLMPIPIKLKAHYSKNNYYIKFYGIDLYSDHDGMIRSLLNRSKNKQSSKKSNYKKYEDLKDKSKVKKSRSFSFRKIYSVLQSNKFKPGLKISLKGDYSLSDASATAVSYGLINDVNVIAYKIFIDFFKVKKADFSLNPSFKNTFLINLNLNCIITFNIAQIIYMLFLVIKTSKEVPLHQ